MHKGHYWVRQAEQSLTSWDETIVLRREEKKCLHLSEHKERYQKKQDYVRENNQNTEKRHQPAAGAYCSCCISPLAQQASAFFSRTSTDRKQMRGNYNGIKRERKKKDSSVNAQNLFWGFGNLIPRLTFFMPLDFINGRKITVTDYKDCKNSFCIPVEVPFFQRCSGISGTSTGGPTNKGT